MSDEPEGAVTQAETGSGPGDLEPSTSEGETGGEAPREGATGTTTARRRRRRGSRGRGRSTAGGQQSNGESAGAEAEGNGAEQPAGSDSAEQPAKASTPTRSRSRSRSPAKVTTATEPSGDGNEPSPRAEASGDGPGAPADADTSTAQGPTAGTGDGEEGGTGTTTARRRRRRGSRGRGRSRSGGGAAKADADAVASDPPEEEAAKGSSGAGSAGSRSRSRPKSSDESTATTSSEGQEQLSPSAKRRRRRKRAATGGTTAATDGGDRSKDTPSAGGGAAKAAAAAPTRTARRRGRGGSGSGAKESRAKESRSGAKESGTKESDEGGSTRTRRSRATLRRRESMPTVPRGTGKLMLITEHGERDQIAVVEDRQLVEHYITRVGAKSMVGNIYLGRVQNVLPGMEAAFIDIGKGRNAVLYAGEVSYDEDIGRQQRIEQVLKAGQAALVQVTKDPIGGKGPRLTQEISLPGRYVVMVPNSDVFGISRRLPDNERRRLRTVIRKVRPEQHGVIVRTAAEGASEEDLAADLKRLAAEWEQISKKAKKAKAPHLLYEEPELTVRVVRDLFNDEEFKEIVTDTEPVFALVRDYLASVAPELVEKVRLHDGKLPLFEQYHLIEQIHKALERKVWLPSGGYIVIDKTEAMTVIDVNTGKHVGKANLEETVTKTNLEAAEEIARQLRLRDIGGMILIDFIDMLLDQNKRQVIDTLKNAMAKDKTRSQVFDISPLGILEITRKRVSAGLLESFSETCPTCGGRGILITHEI